MAAKFEASTAKVLASCGWQVGAGSAVLKEGAIIRRVWADGRWKVTQAGELVKEGTETHPALAACDANEIAWALRANLWAEG